MASNDFTSVPAGWQSANWYHVMNKTKHVTYLNIILNTAVVCNKRNEQLIN